MGTRVNKTHNGIGFLPNNKHRSASDIMGKKVSSLWDLIASTNANPFLIENSILLMIIEIN